MGGALPGADPPRGADGDGGREPLLVPSRRSAVHLPARRPGPPRDRRHERARAPPRLGDAIVPTAGRELGSSGARSRRPGGDAARAVGRRPARLEREDLTEGAHPRRALTGAPRIDRAVARRRRRRGDHDRGAAGHHPRDP